MKLDLRQLCAVTALCAAPALHAQFNILGQTVDIHGFASQGFAYSNQNNYLTMNTSGGSFDFTDGAINISTRFGSKFRIGAQGYVRSIGQLGHGHVTLDWAFADYKFNDWIGIRGGRIKTALGLYNDTQDMEFMYTWAILPQAMYPLDLRSANIAHDGGDVYGEIPLKKLGSVSYTAYAGARIVDNTSGTYYNLIDQGVPIRTYSGRMEGFDAKWNTKISGLMVGYSFSNQRQLINGNLVQEYDAPFTYVTSPGHQTAVYADYVRGKLHFSGEFRRDRENGLTTYFGQTNSLNESTEGFFVALAYRLTSRLEVGAYNSRFFVDNPQNPSDPNAHHIFDQVATARFDIKRWWSVKLEGHFINGYGDVYSAHGFYLRSNPEGLKPTTNMLVIRTAFNF
jgi:hypothetical protein